MRKFLIAAIAALSLIGSLAAPAFAEQPIISKSSGVVSNATATATMTGTAQQFTYVTGFQITAAGATAAACVTATLTGTLGGGNNYVYCVPAGAAAAAPSLAVSFYPPLRSSAVNTNIAISLPALGAGNTAAAVVLQGYVE